MIDKNKYISYLYQKYLQHSATDKNFDQFFDFLKNPENLEILKQEMNQDWQSGDYQDGFSPLHWEKIEMEVRKRKEDEQKYRLERQKQWYWWTAAASFLLMIGISVGIYHYSGPGKYMTYKTGYGEVKKIMLDDGSQVTLNANSVLKWKCEWKGMGKRIAILDGEAYFDVETIHDQTDKKTGFDVQTNDMTIQVVGTSFNVKSRTEKTDVFLDEGKIVLDLNEKIMISKPNNEKEDATIIMNPGQSVSYSSKTKKLERAESDQYGNASWMVGTFMYTNESVEDILHSLEDIYGVNFQYNDPSIMYRKLTTNLPYSDWPIVESALELLLKARLEKKDKTILIIRNE